MSDASAYFSSPKGITVLWVGLLAAPVAWALHLGAVTTLVGWACKSGSVALLHLISLLMLALALVGGGMAQRCWQRLRQAPPGSQVPVLKRSSFMALSGMLLSGFFVLVILMQWLPVFLFDPCIVR